MRKTTKRTAALLAALTAACVSAPEPEDSQPRLVLVLAIDQLRRDRLDPALPGGLGRLAREGRVFVDSALEHAKTETCPGHVAMLTGRHPGPAGIPGNGFISRSDLTLQYCVSDPSPDAQVIGGEERRSPRNLQVSSFGDWLKAQHPGSRVFGVSGKDRSAIALGGERADAAFWVDWTQGRFTSSRYYLEELPEWVIGFRASPLPREWSYESAAAADGARPDDYPGENPAASRTSPHPLDFVAQLQRSPFADRIALEFAETLVNEEGLGRDASPDLLGLALSATDWIGHSYGPRSQEALDALRRLDRELGVFLRQLERSLGKRRVLVVLTADHGVLPLPEWLQEQGTSSCPVAGGRIDPTAMARELVAALGTEFGPAPADSWFVVLGGELTMRRAEALERGIEPEALLARTRALLELHPGVERVWTHEELGSGSGPEPFATLYRNSFHPERSGDLLVQPARDCLFGSLPFGTSHGSPWPYDRDVPLVFWGPGVVPGSVAGPAGPVDIAPTLAAHLGIPAPVSLDGRVLPLR